MTDMIQIRTALIEKTLFLSECKQFEVELNSNGRKLVNRLHDRGRDRTFRQAGPGIFHAAVWQQFSCLLFLCLIAVGASASAQTGSMVPTVETIIARMVQAQSDNRAGFRSYIVTRDYKLFGKDRHNSKSQVTADVTFVPRAPKST